MSVNLKIVPFSDIANDVTLQKKIKQMMRSTVNEHFKINKNTDVIFIATTGAKLLGIGMLSEHSPNYHCKNETKDVSKIPYLYNLVCDQKYRALKASVALITAIKNYVVENSNKFDKIQINADVGLDNAKSLKFFMRNMFLVSKKWTNSIQDIEYATLIWEPDVLV